jgi:hypothetical protein
MFRCVVLVDLEEVVVVHDRPHHLLDVVGLLGFGGTMVRSDSSTRKGSSSQGMTGGSSALLEGR